jgi:hypothetical protein
MIISTVSINDFHNAFNSMRPNNFTYEALDAIYDYIYEVASMTGDTYKLDFIALCCDWCEYASFEDLQKDYCNIDTLEELDDKTLVLGLDNGGLVLQTF